MGFEFVVGKNKFAPFFWTQFLGAFNDNFFKNALVVLVAFRGVQLAGLGAGSLVALAGGLFILPFFLFSPLAGQISDKFEKSKVIRIVKAMEIVIMSLAAVGLLLEDYFLLFGVLFLMGAQSAFFGPAKYSLIPELVGPEELTKGNAFIELGTFLAILLGTICGGVVSAMPAANMVLSVGLVAMAVAGYLTSRRVSESISGSSELKINFNPIPEYFRLWKLLSEKKAVFKAVLAISWFWFFGAGVLSVLPIYVQDYLMGNEQLVTLFLAMFTIGIGVGSILCEKISFQKVEVGLVPIGALGMSIFLGDIFVVGMPWPGVAAETVTVMRFLSSGSGIRLLVDFLLMSIFAGLFIVPLYALLQERSDEKKLSRVIASNNILNAIFMVVSSLLVVGLYHVGMDPAQVLLIFAGLNFLAAMAMYFTIPEFTLRFYSWILSRVMYSVKTEGLEHIPKSGPFVLVSQHVTFVDWLLISGACKRPLRFVMYYKFFKIPFIRHLMKQARVIPIAGAKENPKLLQTAFDMISKELRSGQPICIFPEGQLTLDGELSPFKPGIEKILKNDEVPVVPVVLSGLWGSIFSKKENKERPHRRKIGIQFYPRIPAGQISADQLQVFYKDKVQKVESVVTPGTPYSPPI